MNRIEKMLLDCTMWKQFLFEWSEQFQKVQWNSNLSDKGNTNTIFQQKSKEKLLFRDNKIPPNLNQFKDCHEILDFVNPLKKLVPNV